MKQCGLDRAGRVCVQRTDLIQPRKKMPLVWYHRGFRLQSCSGQGFMLIVWINQRKYIIYSYNSLGERYCCYSAVDVETEARHLGNFSKAAARVQVQSWGQTMSSVWDLSGNHNSIRFVDCSTVEEAADVSGWIMIQRTQQQQVKTILIPACFFFIPFKFLHIGLKMPPT